MITLMSVVLPEPFGPMSPRISPVSTVKLTSSTALRPANDLQRCATSSTLIVRLTRVVPCTSPGREPCIGHGACEFQGRARERTPPWLTYS